MATQPLIPKAQQKWLGQFNPLSEQDTRPEQVTLVEAIELYLTDNCSLGRAAEMAGVTRWDIMDILYERGIPTNGGHDLTLEEYETMFDRMEGRTW